MDELLNPLVAGAQWYYKGEFSPDSSRLFLIVAGYNPGKPNERSLYHTYLGDLLAVYGSVVRVEPQTALSAAAEFNPNAIIFTKWQTTSYAGEPTTPELVRDLRQQSPEVPIILDPPCRTYQKNEWVEQEVFAAGVSIILPRHLFQPLTIQTYFETGII